MEEGDEQGKHEHGIAVKIRNKPKEKKSRLRKRNRETGEREEKRTTEEPSVLEMAHKQYAALQGIRLQVAAEKK